ncbi:MAG: thiamine ABC transporter substrate-binding protein [Chloroflexota bacterium]
MKRFVYSLLVFCLLLTATACGSSVPQAPVLQATQLPTDVPPTPVMAAAAGELRTLTVMTHDSFSASEGVIQEFEQANNVKITFVKSGDAGAALNKAILSKDAPLADVFYGVDNTFLSRALESGIFEPYASPMIDKIPDEFKLDLKNHALPVDYADVCINYSKAFFAKNGIPVPASLDDLIKPEYFGALVVENPATSSTGLAFLLATIQKYGDPGYLDFWKALKANGLVVVDGWETAYYTNFSAASGNGPQPMVLSYVSSPAAEVAFSSTPLDESPIGTISSAGSCFRQVEFVGILAGTKNRDLAEKFVDFMLDVPFQEGMPLSMFVYPVNGMAVLPDIFTKYSLPADQPASVPADISAKRDGWIQAWTQAVLQ